MSDHTPTPSRAQAHAAVAEAAVWPAVVRKAEWPLRLIPLVLAATYLAAAVFAALPWAHAGRAVLLILGVGLAGAIVLSVRIRAYSRVGKRRFQIALGAFCLWNGAVVGASVLLGWWAPGSPPWHLAVSTCVAVLPLLAATVLAWRSGR